MELAIETLRNIGLTQIEAQVYIKLAKNGACSRKELACSMGLNASQLSQSLTGLEKKGFIKYLTLTKTIISAIPLDIVLDYLENKKLTEAQGLKKSRQDLERSKP